MVSESEDLLQSLWADTMVPKAPCAAIKPQYCVLAVPDSVPHFPDWKPKTHLLSPGDVLQFKWIVLGWLHECSRWMKAASNVYRKRG